MSYDQQTWALGVGGGMALNPTHLNHMEVGIKGAHDAIDNLAGAHHTHVSADITDATSSNTVSTIVKRDGTGFIAVSGITGLSTATGSTQAVPKAQLDAAIATLAATTHTHTLSQITDVTATGTDLAKAADVASARDVLDVYSTAETDTSIAAAIVAAAPATTSDIAAALATAETYTDTVTANLAYVNEYASSVYPVRQNTAASGRKVFWVGPAATPVPLDGTTSGGTRKAAPGDLIFYY